MDVVGQLPGSEGQHRASEDQPRASEGQPPGNARVAQVGSALHLVVQVPNGDVLAHGRANAWPVVAAEHPIALVFSNFRLNHPHTLPLLFS